MKQAKHTKQPPPGSAKALLVWLHGFNDHCNHYDEFFHTLASHGIAVHSLDRRGWGRSVTRQSDKGRTGPRQTVLSDITDFVYSLPQTGLPLFLGGHSMGGAEALLWAAQAPPKARLAFRGYVIAAPLIRLHPSVAPPKIVFWFASLLAYWFPNFQCRQKPHLQYMSRDGEVQQALDHDALCHDTATVQCIVGVMRTGDELAEGLHDLHGTDTEGTSLWIGHGDCDNIVCHDAARAYVARSPIKDKQFRSYEGYYHNLHEEPGQKKADFANDVVTWIIERAV